MGCGTSHEGLPPDYGQHMQKAMLKEASIITSAGSETGTRSTNAMERQLERYGYPPPEPPASRKKQVFDKKQHAAIDKYASKLPTDVLYASFEEVGQYLTKNCKNDIEKVRALFVWTTSIDISSLQSTLEKLPDAGTPLDYLLRIHWQMGNHAHFFAQLCRAAGLPCIIVTGVNKSAAYTLGGKVERSGMAAQWNAVYCDGNWRLIDVFWASTCVIGARSAEWALVDVDGDIVEDEEEENDGETKHQVNEAFFLTDPDQLVCTHLPDDPAWQLLPYPLTQEHFERSVYIRERFFQLDMEMVPDSKLECIQATNGGQVDLRFGIPKERAKDIQYRYLLFRNRQRGERPVNIPFERFVFYQKKADNISYNAKFPVAGRFKLDIFGQDEKEDETFDLCASYLIDCDDPMKDIQPLPDCPEIGWGPGVEAEKAGMKATSHEDAVIETDDGKVEVRFALDNPLSVLQTVKNNELDEFLLKRHAMLRVDGNELVVTMRLPKKGDYALNIFGDDKDAVGDLPNVCNYLVKVLKDSECRAFPKLHEGIVGEGHLASKLGVKAKSHTAEFINTDTGKVKVDFEADEDVELFCELHHNDIERNALSKCVRTDVDGKNRSFNLDLPQAGEYAMNVYARKKGENRIYHVHSYLVNSTQSDKQDIEKSQEDVPIEPIYTTKSYVEIRVPKGDGEKFTELRKRNAQEGLDSGKITCRSEGNEDVYTVKLPEEGEYTFDVFEKQESGALAATTTYRILRDEAPPGQVEEEKAAAKDEHLSEEEKQKQREMRALEAKYKKYRDNLKAAMASQDVGLIAQAIQDYEKAGIPEHKGDLTKAKKLLDFLTISQELTDAMSKRNLAQLEKAIARAEKAGVDKKLGLQMQMAYRIRDQLKRIEKLRHAILNLDQKTIAEIKSYGKPPEAVHTVMSATFILLGEPEKKLKDWKAVQVLIGKTGKESLKRRIQEFNVEKLNIEIASKAKRAIEKFTLDETRDVSAGAGTFYVWSIGMIEESESRYVQGGGDLKSLSTRPKTGKGRRGTKA